MQNWHSLEALKSEMEMEFEWEIFIGDECVQRKRRKDWREEGERHASLTIFTNPARVLDQHDLFVSFERAWPVHFCFYHTWAFVRRCALWARWISAGLEHAGLEGPGGSWRSQRCRLPAITWGWEWAFFQKGIWLGISMFATKTLIQPRRECENCKSWSSGPGWVEPKQYDHNN